MVRAVLPEPPEALCLPMSPRACSLCGFRRSALVSTQRGRLRRPPVREDGFTKLFTFLATVRGFHAVSARRTDDVAHHS